MEAIKNTWSRTNRTLVKNYKVNLTASHCRVSKIRSYRVIALEGAQELIHAFFRRLGTGPVDLLTQSCIIAKACKLHSIIE